MNNFVMEMEDVPDVYHHSLWCEKYRPSKFDDFIGSDVVKKTLKIL